MCEILIFRGYNGGEHPEPEIEAGRFKNGDVVMIAPDGHPWAPGDLGAHIHRLQLPGVDPADLSLLMASDFTMTGRVEMRPSMVAPIRHLRLYNIRDFDNLPHIVFKTAERFLADHAVLKPRPIPPGIVETDRVISK